MRSIAPEVPKKKWSTGDIAARLSKMKFVISSRTRQKVAVLAWA
jgi:hypothetical protein